jgi:hypothetical protein
MQSFLPPSFLAQPATYRKFFLMPPATSSRTLPPLHSHLSHSVPRRPDLLYTLEILTGTNPPTTLNTNSSYDGISINPPSMTHSPPHGTTPTPANLFQNPLPERSNLKERCHTLRWLHNRRTVDFPFRFKSLQIFSSYVLTAVAFESESKSTAATLLPEGKSHDTDEQRNSNHRLSSNV